MKHHIPTDPPARQRSVRGRREKAAFLTERPSPPQSHSEQTAWMLRVRDHRDRAAFGLLFDHFAPRLKAMIMRSGAGAAQAEDIAQDVMLSVWQRAGQFDPARAQVSGWIYQIARNRHIDILRKEQKPLPEPLKILEPDTQDAQHALALDQEAAHLRAAISQLSPAQRQVVEHAYMGDLSHREIQEKTGLALGTIKSRLRLALEKLRHDLKGTLSE